ncbi:NADPH-dependent F420 reductase [Paenibacillus cellulositrophicus]|uniref:NADPH-dependent F420 reductase n=1 Tax=Paenibacillus cellulositrophicus TaxID=562959 RepID=UPI001267754F|nr:NADPH-dependent F420 reductase [Paenibacillus cellulositrophicus]
MKLSILGNGSVGRKLAVLFNDANHQVIVGARSTPSASEHSGIQYVTIEEAAAQGDVVILAIPYIASVEVLPQLESTLAQKIVIDCMNPLHSDWSPLDLGERTSAGEETAKRLPQSRVIKAFNTTFADIMSPDRIIRNGSQATAFVAGDEAEAKKIVMRLAEEIGFAPLDAGALSSSKYLEGMAHLNIRIAVGLGGGTDAAFLYHQAK